jgi:hypothetical protein
MPRATTRSGSGCGVVETSPAAGDCGYTAEMRTLRSSAVVTCLALAASAVARPLPPPNPYPGYASAIYANTANWLCRPDTDDVCDRDLDATVVLPSGRTRLERFKAARNPKIDCFYVYPTISTDMGGNSDLVPGMNEELFVVRQQAARLGAVCRVFAPVYRQVTLTALISRLGGNPIPSDGAAAYADVLDAWKHYVANDNQGRGVILIGHSQGAGHLRTLVATEIDAEETLRARLVSAMLLGSSVQVPVDADVGADFQNVPLCRRRKDTGCVVSYASFRATSPPPANSLFGRSAQAGWKAACTNPAALAGGSRFLRPYLPTDGRTLPIFLPPPPAWVDPSRGAVITTPFVTLPRFVSAACADNGFSYLGITLHGEPDDVRLDDIPGANITPEWGLHLVDANVAMGDLVRLANSQATAYRRR